MASISLNAYEQAERTLGEVEARRGITVHAVITLIVSIALIAVNAWAVNVFFATEFPWSAFAVTGMLIGLGFHYYYGFLHARQNVEAHQRQIEAMAQGLR